MLSKQQSIIFKRNTLSDMRREIQLIEEVKYLISKCGSLKQPYLINSEIKMSKLE